MTDQLLERIEKLEKQNKRMRLAMLALCICLVTLLTMAQTVPQPAAGSLQRIEAKEIVLSDGTTIAKLTPGSLVFSTKSGQSAETAAVAASGIIVGGRYATEIIPSGIVCRRDGVPRFDLHVGEIGAQLSMKNGAGLLGTMIDESTLILINNSGILSMRPEHLFLQKGEADAYLTASMLKIRDADMYKAILGQAEPAKSDRDSARAGSAASLILLSKDNKVLWQTP